MRPSQKQNRARGRGNRKPNGNIVNRVFESAGPEGKVRGTPQQIIDKYLTLARDAQTSGDRVMSENFLQHAEHYQRILVDAQGARDEQRRDQRQDQDGPDGDGREDFGSEQSEEAHASRQPEQRRDERVEAGHRGGAEHGGGERRRESEVSGLTTIDSGSDNGENLLVEADELSASQPPRRRRNQRRDRGQQAEQSEADAQTE